MSDQDTSANFLDTTGLLCPLPVLKARKRLGSLADGDLLKVVADDPAARVDFPHFCAEQGHELVSLDDLQGEAMAIVIRKMGPAATA